MIFRWQLGETETPSVPMELWYSSSLRTKIATDAGFSKVQKMQCSRCGRMLSTLRNSNSGRRRANSAITRPEPRRATQWRKGERGVEEEGNRRRPPPQDQTRHASTPLPRTPGRRISCTPRCSRYAARGAPSNACSVVAPSRAKSIGQLHVADSN